MVATFELGEYTLSVDNQNPEPSIRKSLAGALRAGSSALTKQAEYGDTHPIEFTIGGPIQATLFLIVSISCTVWLFRNRFKPKSKPANFQVKQLNTKAEITRFNNNKIQPK